jgi:hypothetical protein
MPWLPVFLILRFVMTGQRLTTPVATLFVLLTPSGVHEIFDLSSGEQA